MGVSQVLLVSDAIIMLVHYSAASAGRQDLERFEELDHGVLLPRRQGLKCQSCGCGFPIVSEVDRLTHRRELAGVPKRPLVVETPKLTGEETLVTGEETSRAGRLVLI